MSSREIPEAAFEGVRRMLHHMRRRGPDADGVWSEHGVVLGHRRLAILDLAARANQPMRSHDQRYAIVFNGEIYNFRDLRRTLERQNVAFHTSSDTEVLLELFAREGPAMLKRLRGMFSLAIWDSRERELFLARDPYGIKPLYYTQTGDGFLFASQVKALLASRLVAGACEPAGLAGFYLWGSVPEPWTLHRDVFALPAGHCLRVRNGQVGTPTSWHDVRVHWQGAAGALTGEELAAIVRDALTDSVVAHLVSDVPVGVFLSGGVDSAVVARLAQEHGAQLRAITVGFSEFAGQPADETARAAATAAHYGLGHTRRLFSRAEFSEATPRILDAMDQPSIDGVNTWFASKAAAEQGCKVILSGIGGDELFCGYSTFGRVPQTARLSNLMGAVPGARVLAGAASRYLSRGWCHPRVAGAPAIAGSLAGAYFLHRCLFLPHELPLLMEPELARVGLARLGGSPPGLDPVVARDDVAAVGELESICYLRNQLLRDSDWASMDHSLELRTPLVDVALLTSLAPFVSEFTRGAGKALMAQSPRRPLPTVVANGPKTGFTVPMAKWVAEATGERPWEQRTDSSLGRPWARHWAKIVLDGAMSCA
jgi:asparagine synthase (glutamine-hydrolysing)